MIGAMNMGSPGGFNMGSPVGFNMGSPAGFNPWVQRTPPAMFQSTTEDNEVVQETQLEGSVSSPSKKIKKRSHKAKTTNEPKRYPTQRTWTGAESMALCRAWIDTSEDPDVANFQRMKTFWQRILDTFHRIMKREPYRDTSSLQGKWRKIRKAVQQFNEIWTRRTNNHQSGANDVDMMNECTREYNATNPAFTYMAEWDYMRRSSKWDVVLEVDEDEPRAKRSKTSSDSVGQQSLGSDARVEINLNDDDTDDQLTPPSRFSRPMGRDAARADARAGSSRGGGKGKGKEKADDKDQLVEAINRRVDVEKERIALKKQNLLLKQLGLFMQDTSHLSEEDREQVAEIKKQLRDLQKNQ